MKPKLALAILIGVLLVISIIKKVKKIIIVLIMLALIGMAYLYLNEDIDSLNISTDSHYIVNKAPLTL
jgi:hypothetical protein